MRRSVNVGRHNTISDADGRENHAEWVCSDDSPYSRGTWHAILELAPAPILYRMLRISSHDPVKPGGANWGGRGGLTWRISSCGGNVSGHDSKENESGGHKGIGPKTN